MESCSQCTYSFMIIVIQISEFKDQLFKAAGVPEERFEYFSCGMWCI